MYLGVSCLDLHILLNRTAAFVLSNFWGGVFVMMNNSYWLDIYHFHIAHSVLITLVLKMAIAPKHVGTN
jgi:hypothetical protein